MDYLDLCLFVPNFAANIAKGTWIKNQIPELILLEIKTLDEPEGDYDQLCFKGGRKMPKKRPAGPVKDAAGHHHSSPNDRDII